MTNTTSIDLNYIAEKAAQTLTVIDHKAKAELYKQILPIIKNIASDDNPELRPEKMAAIWQTKYGQEKSTLINDAVLQLKTYHPSGIAGVTQDVQRSKEDGEISMASLRSLWTEQYEPEVVAKLIGAAQTLKTHYHQGILGMVNDLTDLDIRLEMLNQAWEAQYSPEIALRLYSILLNHPQGVDALADQNALEEISNNITQIITSFSHVGNSQTDLYQVPTPLDELMAKAADNDQAAITELLYSTRKINCFRQAIDKMDEKVRQEFNPQPDFSKLYEAAGTCHGQGFDQKTSIDTLLYLTLMDKIGKFFRIEFLIADYNDKVPTTTQELKQELAALSNKGFCLFNLFQLAEMTIDQSTQAKMATIDADKLKFALAAEQYFQQSREHAARCNEIISKTTPLDGAFTPELQNMQHDTMQAITSSLAIKAELMGNDGAIPEVG